MTRREFILSTFSSMIAFGIFGCETAKNKFHFKNSPKKITNVVDQLRWIDDRRRFELSQNEENKSAIELNKLIPEIDSIELSNSYSSEPGENLRIISWNTQRGRHWRKGFRLISEHPYLKNPDIILLGEMDLGMARSGNDHTTKELADALRMNYIYGVEFLELTNGEAGEREKYPGENEWGYHGNAILSKYPLHNPRMIRFPDIEIWYQHYQKRLGGRMALFAEVKINGQRITFVSTHLESSDDKSKIRQNQMKMILNECDKVESNLPIIIGGDFNAAPDEPLFNVLRNSGFVVDKCNDMGQPTQQIFKDGQVQLIKKQIDYIVVRNLSVISDKTSPQVVPAAYPIAKDGKILGDHAIVTVKVKPT